MDSSIETDVPAGVARIRGIDDLGRRQRRTAGEHIRDDTDDLHIAIGAIR